MGAGRGAGRLTITRPRFLLWIALPALLLFGAACGGIAQPEGWAAPTLQSDTLYVSLEHGKISAYTLGASPAPAWQNGPFPGDEERVPLVVENGKNLSAPKAEKIKFEGFYGDPKISDDLVYTTAYSGHVVALNAKDGRARWVAQLPGRMVGGVLIAGDTLYAGNSKGDVYALDKTKGEVRWSRTIGNDIWATPVLAGDRIVIAAMDGSVTAFTTGGEQVWRQKVADSAIAATPAVDGNRIYLGSSDRRVYALDAGNGATVWTSGKGDNWFWSQLLVEGDTVYAGSLGGTVYAFSKDGSGQVSARWSQKVGDLIRSRPVLVGDTLVVGTKDGRLYGLNRATGDRLWEPAAGTVDDPTASHGDLFADLLKAGNGVYASTENSRSNGSIFFLDLGEKKVREIKLK